MRKKDKWILKNKDWVETNIVYCILFALFTAEMLFIAWLFNIPNVVGILNIVCHGFVTFFVVMAIFCISIAVYGIFVLIWDCIKYYTEDFRWGNGRNVRRL